MKNKIRQALKKRGIKISFIISETGLSKSYFYDVMNGKSIPSLANARKMAEVIGVPLDELFPEEKLEMEEVS